MQIYELTLKVFLLKNISANESLEKISRLIDKALAKTDSYLFFHKENKYKNYCFNGFYPVERKKVYKEGNIYSIKIRTVDSDLTQYLTKNLANEYTSFIKALTVEHKIIAKRPIERLYSITPVIIKMDQGYWREYLSIEEYEEKIKSNIIKKYNSYFNKKIDEDFQLFNMIKFDNQKPISCIYKNITILGDKITIVIANNDMAQQLAYFSLGTALGEMNSRGYGFINYKWS